MRNPSPGIEPRRILRRRLCLVAQVSLRYFDCGPAARKYSL
jgi:hypothetical protein